MQPAVGRPAVAYDAVVIGAGFGGIRTMWELDRLGLTMKCFDAASDVGGTWWWNRYPGSRCDCDASVYVLRFAPELLEDWDFRDRCPSQQDLQRYLSRVAGWFPVPHASRPNQPSPGRPADDCGSRFIDMKGRSLPASQAHRVRDTGCGRALQRGRQGMDDHHRRRLFHDLSLLFTGRRAHVQTQGS